ncbi:PAS domain-containing hybrid sensor histidine kinase/response regulator [Leptospira borgpetersenii]|uniref:PAS domain-containing hybrid sensor histidine kinase/response regulator n=3 Tax=Leptospira borgpetersenii TaxID=174 RepID=UPI000772FF0A|nr:PAS domain-containing hybrid sensor histidine kinase/response regulator [Leptospira borgpetersenii]MBE8399121.1 response regulator [Leptospira borgpetersenii serovar Tarassovi]MBE8401865.1 response regulator [Leptospira borgpetersenii serovar Tarassovi]MBE8407844.1 response regulator [Leptospira borgpetersenii serovar Tarassovi]MBE8414200.1 response regulator [Leptospira borgpetersenii serovar Tarassovi]MBE8415998.1 response regulator [Leptospira borgpetersenii serovar Tarassovi]
MTSLQPDFNFLILNSSGDVITWNFYQPFQEFRENLENQIHPSQWNWTTPESWASIWEAAKSLNEKNSFLKTSYQNQKKESLNLEIQVLPLGQNHILFSFFTDPKLSFSETPSIFLQDAELRSTIFQKSTNTILLLDPEKDLILETNQTANLHFETQNPSEILNIPFSNLLAPGFSFSEYESRKRKILSGETPSWEVELKTFRGRKFWGNTSFRTVSTRLNRIILVQIKDITEKVNARKFILEQAATITEQEANLNAIIENLEAMIWSINKNYELLIFNSQFQNAMQDFYHSEISLGFNVLQKELPPKVFEYWKEFYDRALSGEKFSVAGKRPNQDGTFVFSELSFHPIRNAEYEITGVSAVSVDITDKKSAEEKFKLLFERSSEPHVLYDDSGIFECNPATLKMLRCSDKKFVLGKHPIHFSAEIQADGRIEKKMMSEFESISLNKGSYTFEWVYKRFNGEEFSTEVTLIPIIISQKRVFLSVWHEITERKVYEDSLKRAKENAEAASKAKTDFLAMMSHEIRTPLNGVIGTVSLLEGTSLGAEQREYLDIIKSSGQNLLILLNDILDLSRIESGQLTLEMQPVSLKKLTSEVINLFRPMAEEKGLVIEFSISSSVPNWIISDPYRLRQILTNLLGNSIKFTEKGKVLLKVEAEKFPNNKFRLIFHVKDTGIGIAEEKLELLFRAFSQVDSSTTRKYGGSGLGLTISKKLAELMKGEIIVKSQVNQGSEFTLSILVEKLEYEIPAGIQELHSKNLATTAILSLQEFGFREQIKKFCERNGFSVKVVKTAKEAIRTIGEEEKIGIFLTDLNLPDMNLPEMLNELKNQNPSLKLTIILFVEKELKDSYYHVTNGLFNRPGFKIFMMFKPILLEELSKNFEKAFPTKVLKEEKPGENEKLLSERIPLKILLVEDNLINQKIALRLLMKLGYTADAALNGLEAIECLKERKYDLIFMDIQMPEMDGYEATHLIRKDFAKSKPVIVAMTANAMEGDKEKCLEAGMDAYIAKPIQIQDIESAIILLFQS